MNVSFYEDTGANQKSVWIDHVITGEAITNCYQQIRLHTACAFGVCAYVFVLVSACACACDVCVCMCGLLVRSVVVIIELVY